MIISAHAASHRSVFYHIHGCACNSQRTMHTLGVFVSWGASLKQTACLRRRDSADTAARADPQRCGGLLHILPDGHSPASGVSVTTGLPGALSELTFRPSP